MPAITPSLTRRQFLRGTTATAAAFMIVPRHVIAASGQTPPSEKLNLAFIGTGGRAAANLGGLGGQNVVALCDVDPSRAKAALEKHPKARFYQDFRILLEEQEKAIDAVAISTPDHTHAVVALAAIQRRKHVYCEKPLAHSIHEVRTLQKAARANKVITQMGNQGHSSDTIRTFCEWIWSGAIGQVHTIHAVSAARHCKVDQLPLLKQEHPVPASLNWDLWLGPAQFRPYHPLYLPGKWRGWMPFGSGAIGDWVCHVVDPVFWALDLGAPTSVQAQAKDYNPQAHADTFPPGSIITFEFAANAKRGPVKLVWFDGQETPPRPKDLEADDKMPSTGAVVMGDKGTILYGSHGAGGVRLIPQARMDAFQRPEKTLPRIKGHYEDFLNAVRSNQPAGSNFEYGGALTELALLGIIATKHLGKRLEWDARNLRFPNLPAADALIHPSARKGWEV